MVGFFKPGAEVANAPSTFEYLKSSFLQHNSNTARMPTSQREWNSFIQELSKLIKNETGIFAPTFNGFSSDPATPTCVWQRYGQVVQLEFVFTTGTSDLNAFTISNLPTVITPNINVYQTISGLVDNGTNLANSEVEISSQGTVAFYADGHEGTWTTSGDKGFSSATNEKSVIYLLRNPDKQ